MSISEFKPHLYKTIALFFFIIVIFLAILITHVALSKATITITGKQELLQSNIETVITFTPLETEKVDEETSSENKDQETEKLKETLESSKKIIVSGPNSQAGILLTVNTSGQKTYQPQGAGEIVPAKVTGEVTLYNDSNQAQTLVVRTQLQSANKQIFRLTEGVKIPANSQIKANVLADEAGTEAEIAAGDLTIIKLPRSKQKVIYAKNEQAFQGGTTTVKKINTKDLQQAQVDLTKHLEEKGLAELQKKNPQIKLKDLSSINLNLESEHTKGDQVTEFEVKGTLTVIALIFDKEELQQQTQLKLQKEVGEEKTLIAIDENSFDYQIEQLSFQQGKAVINSYLSGQIATKNGNSFIPKKALINLSAEKIQDLYLQQAAVSSVEVMFWPFWVKKTPRLLQNITIKLLNESDQPETPEMIPTKEDLKDNYLE